MKKNIFLLISVLLVGNIYAKKVKVSGTVTGQMASGYDQVSLLCNGQLSNAKIEDGKYETYVDIDSDQFVKIMLRNVMLNAYVTPEREAKIDLILESMYSTKISTSDKKDEANQFLMKLDEIAVKNKITGFGDNGLFFFRMYKDRRVQTLKEARELLNSHAKKLNQKYDNFVATTKRLYHYLEVYSSLETMSESVVITELENLKKSNLSNSEFSVPVFEAYLKDLANVAAADKISLYQYKVGREHPAKDIINAEMLMKYCPNPEMLNVVLYKELSKKMNGDLIQSNKLFDFVFGKVQSKSMDILKEQYAVKLKEANKFNTGDKQKAFNFEFVDKDGKKYQLDDFKGKLLFIDCWASWCTPCRGQIPALKVLEKKYEGRNIEFISVSLDQSKKAWLKAAKEEDLHGYVLHAPDNFKNAFAKHYGINAIPRFMLFDENGYVINDRMPRPSDKADVCAIIDARLNVEIVDEIIKKNKEVMGVKRFDNKMMHYAMGASSMVGGDKKTEGFLTIQNERKVTTTTKDDESNGSSESALVVLQKDGFEYREGNKKKNQGMAEMLGYDLYFHEKKGVTFTLNKESFCNDENQYILDCNYNNTLIKVFICKDSYLVKRVEFDTPVGRTYGGGVMKASYNYKTYVEKDGYMHLKKYDVYGVFQNSIESVEFVDYDAKTFEI